MFIGNRNALTTLDCGSTEILVRRVKMPDVKIVLLSQRNRPVTDKVLEADFDGTHYVHPLDIKKGRGFVLADVVPGRYRVFIKVAGFRRSQFSFSAKAGRDLIVKCKIQHRCTKLPTWSDLCSEQKRLLASCAGQQSPQRFWGNLSDNHACTFFQISYVLARTVIGGTMLSDYINRVRVIGGAEIIDRAPDGRERRAVGWRMHVAIKPKYRAKIKGDLAQAFFKEDKGLVHPTHTRFGYTKSFRQQGQPPWLQLVLKPSAPGGSQYVEADVDLDVNPPLRVHLSSPHDVYPALKKKFPPVGRIYQVK